MDSFNTIIQPKHKIFDLHLRETLRYKDLIFLFVKRDFSAYYKQTILGPLWAIVQPLLTTVIFTIVFGNLARLTVADSPEKETIPSFLFYLAGNIYWFYFSSTLKSTSETFIKNRNLMGKVYFPRLVAPIASACSNLISFVIQLIMFLCFWTYYLIVGGTSIQVKPNIILFPLTVIQMMCLSIGCGIIVSATTTKYRDLAMLVGFGLQLWQYASPIAYGLELIPDNLRNLYLLNPLTIIVTTFRYAVFGFGFFSWGFYILSWGITLLLLLFGLVLFSRIERAFMDTI